MMSRGHAGGGDGVSQLQDFFAEHGACPILSKNEIKWSANLWMWNAEFPTWKADFSKTGMAQKEFVNRVKNEAKIAANLGATFGKNGHSFLRFNFATTTDNVRIAAERLSTAFSDLQ